MPQCPSFSPLLHRPQRRSLRYPTQTSTRSILIGQRSCVRPQRSAHAPQRPRSVRSIASPHLRHLVRGPQIPIAPAPPPHIPPSRFPPLEAFGRRPPECGASFASGRHPKPFTKVDLPAAWRAPSNDSNWHLKHVRCVPPQRPYSTAQYRSPQPNTCWDSRTIIQNFSTSSFSSILLEILPTEPAPRE
jgi:hypothetical protein